MDVINFSILMENIMAYFVFVNSVHCFVCQSGYVLWLMAYRKACELGL